MQIKALKVCDIFFKGFIAEIILHCLNLIDTENYRIFVQRM